MPPISPLEGMSTKAYSTGSPEQFILEGDGITENTLPQTGNILRYWHFSDGSGTTISDASTNADDATLNSTPTWSSGYNGYGAVDFSGEYATFSNVTFTNYTLLVLYNADPGGSGNRTIINTAQDDDILTRVADGPAFSGHHHDGGGYKPWSISTTTDAWELWWVRYDGSTVEVIDTSTPASDSFSASAPVGRGGVAPTIGSFDAGSIEDFDGEMSLILLWDTNLTDSELNGVASDLGF